MNIAMQIILILFSLFFFISCFSTTDNVNLRYFYLSGAGVSASLFIAVNYLL